MIDPNNITNYALTDEQLEEQLLFWVCAAGKTAKSAAKGLQNFLEMIGGFIHGPFKAIRVQSAMETLGINILPKLPEILRSCGIGSYNGKAETMRQLAFSDLNLRTCSPGALETIKGIGPKTSRCFILHTRRNARFAGLDTHILKFLRSKGHDVPKNTPGDKKVYKKLEKLVLKYADEAGMTPAGFDLEIWKKYANGVDKSK